MTTPLIITGCYLAADKEEKKTRWINHVWFYCHFFCALADHVAILCCSFFTSRSSVASSWNASIKNSKSINQSVTKKIIKSLLKQVFVTVALLWKIFAFNWQLQMQLSILNMMATRRCYLNWFTVRHFICRRLPNILLILHFNRNTIPYEKQPSNWRIPFFLVYLHVTFAHSLACRIE